jgi:outer membrane protein assembly factor BamB
MGHGYRVEMASWRSRFEAVLGLIVLIALVATYLAISGRNPLPTAGAALKGFLAHTGSLSSPEAAWVRRLDDQPTAGTVAGSAVVFTTQAGAEVRDAADGRALWSRQAQWVAVAGDGAGAVVILGGGRDGGYDAVDPMSGAVRWHDPGLAVWAYRDALLSLACPAGKDCALSARSLAGGVARWTVGLPAGARLLAGAHRATDELPALLGLTVDGRIRVVDTATGRRLREQESSASTRVAVMGGRIVASTAQRRGDGCRYSVEARDAASGRTVWRTDGYDLGTASGAGCEQRRDPTGARRALVATRSDNRPTVLSTADGRELWTGTPGESVLATDGQDAVVRSAGSVALVDLDGGHVRWVRPAAGDVTLTPYAVVVTDAAAGRLVAYGRTDGAVVADVSTEASVLGAGPDRLVVGRGRTVGVLQFGGAAR